MPIGIVIAVAVVLIIVSAVISHIVTVSYLKKKEELKILDVNMYLAESAHIKEQLKETEEKY